MPKYFINPSQSGGQPVQELYDTINYLSGMTADGEPSTDVIAYESPSLFSAPSTFSNNLYLSGDANFDGNNVFSGPSTFDGGIVVNGQNVFNGVNTFNAEQKFLQGLSSNGPSSFTGEAIFSDGKVSISSALNVSGASTFSGATAVAGKLTLWNGADVNGVLNVKDTSTFGSTATFKSGIVVSGESTFNHINVSTLFSSSKIEGNAISCTGLTASTINCSGALTAGSINSSGDITGNRVFGSVFNDYAELFPRGEKTEPGDIIALDTESDKESYRLARKGDKLLIGVHSNQFAHLIGGEKPPYGISFIDYNLPKYIPVGLAGRVKVKVIGNIEKGDKITISTYPGIGIKAKDGDQTIGFALENFNGTDIGLINMKII